MTGLEGRPATGVQKPPTKSLLDCSSQPSDRISAMRIVLPYRPPYDWAAIAAFLSARATPGVERVDPSGYHRTILARGFIGTISVAPMAGADALMVDVAIPDRALVPEIAERVARMFDVDSNPALVAKSLAD